MKPLQGSQEPRCPSEYGQAPPPSIMHTQLLQSSKAKLQKTCYSSGCSEDLCTVTYLGSGRCLPVSRVSWAQGAVMWLQHSCTQKRFLAPCISSPDLQDGSTVLKKKTPPPKHHPDRNQLRCGPKSISSIPLFPCHCRPQFHKWYLFFPQALPHLGAQGGLESGVSPTGRLYLQTWECTWKDGLTPLPPQRCLPEHFNKSQKLRFKL